MGGRTHRKMRGDSQELKLENSKNVVKHKNLTCRNEEPNTGLATPMALLCVQKRDVEYFAP
eukprot:793562-Pleurochrysis_carterae.AAC.1